MMEVVAISMVATCWACLVFTWLQLSVTPRRRSMAALASSTALAMVVLLRHGDGLGPGWIREAALRSDALAIGALTATCATGVGILVDADARRSAWGIVTCSVAAAGSVIAGGVALALGRGDDAWQLAAVIVPGMLLVAIGTPNARRREWSANARIGAAMLVVAGTFVAIAGTAFAVAWRSLA